MLLLDVTLTGTAVPVLTALIAGAFAFRLLGTVAARPVGHRLFWALGLLLLAAGAAAEAYGAAYGWNEATFRIYYLTGAVLAVGMLGLGSAWLHLPRRHALVALGFMLCAVPAATVAVLSADIDLALLAEAGLEPPSNEALEGLAFIWAIVLNTLGTVALLGGAGRSIWLGRARLANVLIASGVILAALSGLLTRAGGQEAVYSTQLAGIVLLYVGFELAARAAERTRRPAATMVAELGA